MQVCGVDFTRVANCVYGNPRYVVHFLAFADSYDVARIRANSIGFSVYRGKSFGGGFVGVSYNLQDTAEKINQLKGI